jgi:hypothetical protein
MKEPQVNSSLSAKIKNDNKESIKTEEIKKNYVKIKKNNKKHNPIDLIPNSIKRIKTNKLEKNKSKNPKSIEKYIKKDKNNSYLKTNESISSKKYKYGIPIFPIINRETRTKTPLICDKNNSQFKTDIYDNYIYYKKYNKLNKKGISQNQKSAGNLITNPRINITEINEMNNNNISIFKNNKINKSNNNIKIKPNNINNYNIRNKIIKKGLNNFDPNIFKIRPSSANFKRIKYFNKKDNNILNYDYIKTIQEKKIIKIFHIII